MAPAGGVAGALIIHAEIKGLPAYKLTAITDGGSISSEMMQIAYGQVMKVHGLDDLSGLTNKKNFRSILKEANQKGHTIFSWLIFINLTQISRQASCPWD